MKVITISINLTDKEFEELEADAKKYDYEVDSFLAKPLSDILFDALGNDETDVSVRIRDVNLEGS